MAELSQTKNISIIWEYSVKHEYIKEFLNTYSPDGAWARLFGNFKGYIKTELLQNQSDIHKFITIDHWSSLIEYKKMKQQSLEQYSILDKQCEPFTITEKRIGIFQNFYKNE